MVRAVLKLPAAWEPQALVTLGRPASVAKQKLRKPIDEVVVVVPRVIEDDPQYQDTDVGRSLLPFAACGQREKQSRGRGLELPRRIASMHRSFMMKATVAVLGGTGHEGRGLAMRWANAGHPVIVGSRDAERARAAAEALLRQAPRGSVAGTDNRTAAERCDIAVLTVPYVAHRDFWRVSGTCPRPIRFSVDVTRAAGASESTRVQLPPETSAAMAAQALLGPEVRVVVGLSERIGAIARDSGRAGGL